MPNRIRLLLNRRRLPFHPHRVAEPLGASLAQLGELCLSLGETLDHDDWRRLGDALVDASVRVRTSVR